MSNERILSIMYRVMVISQSLRRLMGASLFKKYISDNVKKDIINLENKLKDLNLWETSAEDLNRLQVLNGKLNEWLKVDETIWRQRSRAVWLQDGDKTFKFFHGKVGKRRKRNIIVKIKDASGFWWREDDDIERVMMSYFGDLFSSESIEGESAICEVVEDILNDEHILWCARDFDKLEIRDVIQ